MKALSSFFIIKALYFELYLNFILIAAKAKIFEAFY